ncbi:Mov34/MPN/PAD-1 family protein [Bacteroides acidifaciens]|jgi:integrative and conjugative element protein (TIGR02256 family)|uniref:Mov34/MPN/PAD-1 family protein n=1 Tax=Bacteroides acidifaciens TaxID=85831 RepID=UPI0025AF9CA3|nr:Mov34/MPN/PAD-1 family protein [Bacteroides acidifaciens]
MSSHKRLKINIHTIDIEVSESVVLTMKSYRQFSGNELGGILLGSVINNNKIRINKISPPFMVDSSTCSVIRDAEKSNAFIKQEFEESNHTRIYVGEWHTHPENIPTSSIADRVSIEQIYRDSHIVLNIVLMAIIGREEIYWGYYNGKKFITFNPIVV